MLKQLITLTNVGTLLQCSNTFYLTKIDQNGNYAYMNDYFKRKFLTYYQDTSVRSAGAALHPDDHAKSYETYLKCMAEPDKTFEVTLRKRDGKDGYIITHWEYKADAPNGVIDGVVGVGYDITAFESRKEHIKYLTSTLSDIALQQSHSIRRPLANLMGLIELLEEAEQTDEQSRATIAMLRKSCNELSNELDEFFLRDIQIQDNVNPST